MYGKTKISPSDWSDGRVVMALVSGSPDTEFTSEKSRGFESHSDHHYVLFMVYAKYLFFVGGDSFA
jgi:hypothetical protein